jgi:hypothetical protein
MSRTLAPVRCPRERFRRSDGADRAVALPILPSLRVAAIDDLGRFGFVEMPSGSRSAERSERGTGGGGFASAVAAAHLERKRQSRRSSVLVARRSEDD